MKFFLITLLLTGPVAAQNLIEKNETTTPENPTTEKEISDIPASENETPPESDSEPTPEPETETTPPEPALKPAEDPEKLFLPGFDVGRVGDRPTGTHRRLVQRTVTIGEQPQDHRVLLTFDDQIVPADPSHASADEIIEDLKPRGVRAFFFANVPNVSAKSLNPILRTKDSLENKKKRTLKLLEPQREPFIKAIRKIISIKKDDQYLFEVFNHTAFHQNMGRMKPNTAKFEICLVGIRFVEECIESAYQAERPGIKRLRYFRFPFLADPRYKNTQIELDKLFTELGLLSLGETQDSKDFSNNSSKTAYKSLDAGYKGRSYKAQKGNYGRTSKPIALFHTKTWRNIRKGVLKFLDEHPIQ